MHEDRALVSQNSNAISILFSIGTVLLIIGTCYSVVIKLTQTNWKFSEEGGGVGVWAK